MLEGKYPTHLSKDERQSSRKRIFNSKDLFFGSIFQFGRMIYENGKYLPTDCPFRLLIINEFHTCILAREADKPSASSRIEILLVKVPQITFPSFQCRTVQKQQCDTVNEQVCNTVQEQQCNTVQVRDTALPPGLQKIIKIQNDFPPFPWCAVY